jgi:hypothetical protein
MSMIKTSFLALDSPHKGGNSSERFTLLNQLPQGRELALQYDCRHRRLGEYTIASHECLVVSLIGLHPEGGEESWTAQLCRNSETFCGDMFPEFVTISKGRENESSQSISVRLPSGF